MNDERQRHVLSEESSALRTDRDVAAALVQGSYLHQDGHPGSDLDLLVIVREGRPCEFRHAFVDGVRVEQHRLTPHCLRERLASKPGIIHGLLDAQVLFDHDGVVPGLLDEARRALADYRVGEKERAGLAYWLETASEKVGAAAGAGDWRKAAFVTAAATWQVVEGLWAVNGLPAPPGGAVLARLGALERLPPGGVEAFDRLLLGGVEARAAAFRELAGWVAAALHEP